MGTSPGVLRCPKVRPRGAVAFAAAALADRPPQECRGPSTASQAGGEPNKRPLCSSPRLQYRPVGMGEPAAERSWGPREHEEDMETAGGPRRGRPPPAHIPPPGAAAGTPQGRPGEREGTFASVAVSLGQAPDGADSVRITRLPVWDHDRASTICVASPDAVRSSPVGGGVLWTGSGEVASARTRSCCCWGGPRLSRQDSPRREGAGPDPWQVAGGAS